ncbi:hypothetical protein ACEQ8H_001423 [Pleosporales sp. CAS-2024a]
MSTAHPCVRSALTQAFHPPHCGPTASYAVAAFLVPALGKSATRSFACGKRRRSQQSPLVSGAPPRATRDASTYRFPPKPGRRLPKSCIPLPPTEARKDMQQWLAAMDPFLPAHLRRDENGAAAKTPAVTSFDLAVVINSAQDESLDILSYMGLVQGRWAALTWIAKRLTEDGKRILEPPQRLDYSANVTWPQSGLRSLDQITASPLHAERIAPSRKLRTTLDDVTSAPDTIDRRQFAIKRSLGQLWRSLASMILASAERTDAEAAVMPHVLEIIAHFHHIGLMPESVYTYRPHENKYALQQPPTLHMLSSKILTALSDASWRAHEASVKSTQPAAKNLFGHEIPGSRYKLHVTEVGQELWLELVLWSCLHGGWTTDGIAILEQVAAKRETPHGWGLISWREIILAEQQNLPSPARTWRLFPMTGEAAARAEDRARTRRTISSEVVTAFVDAIVNNLRVGVGQRGADPEIVVSQLSTLKVFLDANNLSLGSISWDSVIARIVESGAFMPEKRPEAFLRLFQLATGFGAEVSTANTSATASDEVPYFFEPTTLPLNLLHRTMRAFIDNGDVQGAMTTLISLQQHTDENKQKSLQQFFELLKTQQPQQGEPFTSRLPPVDFPAFEINMPVPLRARLLDLVTESSMHELGRWLLFAQDIDGPLIGRDLYNHRNIAASIVRFGTLAGENDLVIDIVNRVGAWNETHKEQRMPAEVLIALLCSQFKLHHWDSVRRIQQYVTETAGFRPRPIILSSMAAELLRLSAGPENERLEAEEAFSGLLFDWEDILMNNIRTELYCILAIMSTVDDTWTAYCSQFLGVTSRQYMKLPTEDFNRLLRGILDGYGSFKARTTVERWCHVSTATSESRRAPGGLVSMPHIWTGKADQYTDRPLDIELVQKSGTKLTLQGRVQPNRQTFVILFRQVQLEVEQYKWQGEDLPATKREEVGDTLKWAARLLWRLGYDNEDIVRDMGTTLAKLVELDAPVAPTDGESLDGREARSGEAASGNAHSLAVL